MLLGKKSTWGPIFGLEKCLKEINITCWINIVNLLSAESLDLVQCTKSKDSEHLKVHQNYKLSRDHHTYT